MKRQNLKSQPFLVEVRLNPAKIPSWEEYPFNLPAVRHVESVRFHPSVTFFVGENGCGNTTTSLDHGMYVNGGTSGGGGAGNVTIRNNLIYNVDVNAQPGNKGWLFFMNNASPNVTIDHNTGFSTNMWMMPGDSNQPHNNFVYTNNMTAHNTYGIWGQGFGTGNPTSPITFFKSSHTAARTSFV